MRAAVLEEYSAPLRLADVPDPEPGEGEALVRVRTTGICGSDLKLASGALARAASRATTGLPRIPGHEVAGELVEPVDGLETGQPVACYIYETCGRCPSCVEGRRNLCHARVRLGFERDGGLAELVAVPSRNLLPFDGGDFAGAAVTMDAIAVPWKALRGRAGIRAGQSVTIAGAGGLGLHAVQVARRFGCVVAAIDPVESHRARAHELGAELTVGPDEAELIREWSGGGTDVALDASGSPNGFRAAVGATRPGGTVVCCGYFPGVDYSVDSARLVLDEIELKGSVGMDIESARDALRAVELGEVKPVIDGLVPLEEVNSAFARLAAGEAMGRVVVEVRA